MATSGYCGTNDGISASCENVSMATLKPAAEITSYMKCFKYIEKGKNIFGDRIATHDVMMMLWCRL
jgi:hypothetical protein